MRTILTTDYWNAVRDDFCKLTGSFGFTHFSFSFIPDITWFKPDELKSMDALASERITTVPGEFTRKYCSQILSIDQNFIKSMAPETRLIPMLHNNHPKKIELLRAWGMMSNLVVVLENGVLRPFPRKVHCLKNVLF